MGLKEELLFSLEHKLLLVRPLAPVGGEPSPELVGLSELGERSLPTDGCSGVAAKDVAVLQADVSLAGVALEDATACLFCRFPMLHLDPRVALQCSS